MPKQIQVFYGEEKFLLEQAIEQLKLKTIGSSPDVFSFQILEGVQPNYAEMLMAMQTIPCFSPRRLVIIRDPFFLLAKKSKNEEQKAEVESAGETLAEEQEKILLENIKNIPPGVTVIFQINGHVDSRRRLTQALKEVADFTEFKPFAFWEQEKLYDWLVGVFKERGYVLSPEGAELLTQLAGVSLQALSNEIEKIITYVGKKKKIDLADLKAIVSSGELAGFELQDALCVRDIKSALEIANVMLKQGESAIAVLGIIAGLFRLMAQVKELAETGLDHFNISRELGKKPFYVKKILAGCRYYSFTDLKNFLIGLHETDQKIKTGRMAAQLALEYILSSLAK